MRRVCWLCGLIAVVFLAACGSEADFPTATPFYGPTATTAPPATIAPPATATTLRACVTSEGKPVTGTISTYATRWDDADKLANSTSRVTLAPQIATLQTIRRDLQAETFPSCGQESQRTFIAMMDTEIEMLLSFLRQDGDRTVAQLRQDRDAKFYTFTAAMAKMNGEAIPPTPTPIPAPTATITYVFPPTATATATKPPSPCEKNAFSPPESCK